MTVGEWLAHRTPRPPAALAERILAVLGSDAHLPDSQAAEVCLAAAARSLDGILSENRFARESALDLLAVDALTTYAFEHASQSGTAVIESLADRTTHLLGQLMTQRV